MLASFPWQLKFVVRHRSAEELAADLEQIDALVEQLEVPPEARERVLLMPEGTEAEDLRAGYRRILASCEARDYRVGLRLHIELFGHTPGT